MQTIGKYRVEKVLGRGGMGTVYQALDPVIHRKVALKFLLNQADAGQRARFLEEAQITGQLEHPNIVPIFAIGEHAGGHDLRRGERLPLASGHRPTADTSACVSSARRRQHR